jgi:hypothetical protein
MDFQKQIAGKTDQELLDIYVDSDDYQEEFVNQAYHELTKRGVSLEKSEKEKETKSRLSKELLGHDRKGNELYIILGFVSAVLGGLIGIIAGYTYSQSKKYAPSGESYYVYDKQTRDKGRAMMIIGIFAFLVSLIWKFS